MQLILRREKYDSTGCMYKASALANFFNPDRILNDILKLCYKFDANNSLFQLVALCSQSFSLCSQQVGLCSQSSILCSG